METQLSAQSLYVRFIYLIVCYYCCFPFYIAVSEFHSNGIADHNCITAIALAIVFGIIILLFTFVLFSFLFMHACNAMCSLQVTICVQMF